MRTVIVGGGIVGLSCAYELSQLDHEVTVIDAGSTGGCASAGNAGWVTPFFASPRAAPGVVREAVRSFTSADGPARMRPHIEAGFASWIVQFLCASTRGQHAAGTAALQRLARDAHRAFDSLIERGVSFEHHTDGLAVVFKEAENLAHYEQLIVGMRALGYDGPATVYRGSEASDFDPAIRRDIAGAVHLESERHIRPESLTQGLAKAVQCNGGQVIEFDPVSQIVARPAAKWVVIADSGRELWCENVVVAAGYRSKRLLAALGITVPLEVAKGTSMTARGSGTAPTHPLKLYESMVACSPFNDSVRLSGTFDIGVRDSRINPKRLDLVVRHGLSYLSDWRPTDVELEWVGHRPTTADDLPVVGPVPGRPGLYLSTGHGTLGVTLGPVTAALAAKEIASGRSQPSLEPFRLTRF